jgi:hypothetical protein
MPVSVRKFAPVDLPAVRDVLTRCGLAGDMDLSVIAGGIQLVAVRDEQIVGTIQVLPGRPAAYVSYLAVVPEEQKSRAAFLLVTSAEAELRRLGVTRWLANISDAAIPWKRTVEKWGGQPTPTVCTLYSRKL